jgi:hypothetical protein
MPSFVARVERPDRGGRWVQYLSEREQKANYWAKRLDLSGQDTCEQGMKVELLHVDGTETELLAALLFEHTATSEAQTLAAVRQLDQNQRAQMLSDLTAKRENRRHRPGRGFETLRYRFQITADYGAFRDLQRHRLLTAQWQQLTPYLGAQLPDEVKQAGVKDSFDEAFELSRNEYERLKTAGLHHEAPYALCLAYRIRFILDLNAREAMHLIELRSGREGHSSYRAVAHAMHDKIAAVHPAVAKAMSHVDRECAPRLERIAAEERNAAKVATNCSAN